MKWKKSKLDNLCKELYTGNCFEAEAKKEKKKEKVKRLIIETFIHSQRYIYNN